MQSLYYTLFIFSLAICLTTLSLLLPLNTLSLFNTSIIHTSPLYSMAIKWFLSSNAHCTMLSLLPMSILPKCTSVWLLPLFLHFLDELCKSIKHKNGLLSYSLTPWVILHIDNLISSGPHTLPWLPMLIYCSIELEITLKWSLYSSFKYTRCPREEAD